MSYSEPPLDFLVFTLISPASSLNIYIIQVLESSGMVVGVLMTRLSTTLPRRPRVCLVRSRSAQAQAAQAQLLC